MCGDEASSPWRWSPRNKLPVGLLALYAIKAVADSYPTTATSQWLNTEVKMSQATQSMFYAAIFVPYSFKAAYGWLSEVVGGRTKVFATATAIEACLYVVCGLGVRSTTSAFGAVLLRETCSACGEMMLSAALAERVDSTGLSASRAQAEATGARWAGTASAYGLELALYRCGSTTPSSRLVLASTACILLPAAVFSLVAGDALGGRDSKAAVGDGRVFAMVLAAQIACAWVAVKDLLVAHHRILWRAGFYGLAAVGGGLCAALVAADLARPDARRLGRGAAAPALLVFALNAAPSADVQVSNLELYLFLDRKPCYLPYAELVAAAASLASCAAYAISEPTHWLRSSLVAASVASAAAGLVYAPLSRAEPFGVGSGEVCVVSWMCFGRLGYDVLARALDGFFGELALLARTTLVLRAALSLSRTAPRSVAYGALLALSDAAASVSGWIAAPLVTRARITYGDFRRLPWLLDVCALAQVAALAPLPFVRLDDTEPDERRQRRHDDYSYLDEEDDAAEGPPLASPAALAPADPPARSESGSTQHGTSS